MPLFFYFFSFIDSFYIVHICLLYLFFLTFREMEHIAIECGLAPTCRIDTMCHDQTTLLARRNTRFTRVNGLHKVVVTHWLVDIHSYVQARHIDSTSAPHIAHSSRVVRPTRHLRSPCALSLSACVFTPPRVPRTSAARSSGPGSARASRLDPCPGWPRSSRGRATYLFHSRLIHGADAAQWVAGAARSAHVRGLPRPSEAPGVANFGRAQRQAIAFGAGCSQSLARQPAPVLSCALSALSCRAARHSRCGLRRCAAQYLAPARWCLTPAGSAVFS